MVSLADIQINRSFEADEAPADDLTQVPMQAVFTPQGAGGDERRMQVRAYNFWLNLAAADELPAIEDLRPEDMDDLGPNGMVLDLTLGRENPSILFIGEKLAEACGTSEEIMSAGDVPGRSLLARLTEHGLEVVANRSPVGFDAEFVDIAGRLILYRSILLPFSSDGRTIDFIFGVISWKEDAGEPAPAPAPLLDVPARQPFGRLVNAPVELPTPQPTPPEPAMPAEARPDGLRDLLELARQTAGEARACEGRGHAALYAALGRAHDLALAAAAEPQDYADLLADAGIARSERAPLVALARLVFGRGYDKTRLAEYAAVLGCAQRLGLARGTVADWLATTPGGLRAVVADERAHRRAETGRPQLRHRVRAGTARRLKGLAAVALDDGFRPEREFALLVARRGPAGQLEVLGEADDTRLLETAARRLLG